MIIGEIEDNIYLCYSLQDHSFAKWNVQTNRFKTVNLIDPRDPETQNGLPIPTSMQKSIFEANETFKWLSLHPACFNSQNCFIFGVNQNDQIFAKQFKVIDGLSKPLRIKEQKPGLKPYEITLSKDGYVAVYYVVAQTQPVELSISVDMLNESFDSDNAYDDLADGSAEYSKQ